MQLNYNPFDIESIEQASLDARVFGLSLSGNTTYDEEKTKLCTDWRIYHEQVALLKRAVYVASLLAEARSEYDWAWSIYQVLNNALQEVTV